MSKILESIGNAVHHAHDNAHDLAAVTKSLAEEKLLDIPYVDLTIQVRQRGSPLDNTTLIIFT
jgi:hypothetical protein